jgi:hypothetical protein
VGVSNDVAFPVVTGSAVAGRPPATTDETNDVATVQPNSTLADLGLHVNFE